MMLPLTIGIFLWWLFRRVTLGRWFLLFALCSYSGFAYAQGTSAQSTEAPRVQFSWWSWYDDPLNSTGPHYVAYYYPGSAGSHTSFTAAGLNYNDWRTTAQATQSPIYDLQWDGSKWTCRTWICIAGASSVYESGPHTMTVSVEVPSNRSFYTVTVQVDTTTYTGYVPRSYTYYAPLHYAQSVGSYYVSVGSLAGNERHKDSVLNAWGIHLYGDFISPTAGGSGSSDADYGDASDIEPERTEESPEEYWYEDPEALFNDSSVESTASTIAADLPYPILSFDPGTDSPGVRFSRICETLIGTAWTTDGNSSVAGMASPWVVMGYSNPKHFFDEFWSTLEAFRTDPSYFWNPILPYLQVVGDFFFTLFLFGSIWHLVCFSIGFDNAPQLPFGG